LAVDASRLGFAVDLAASAALAADAVAGGFSVAHKVAGRAGRAAHDRTVAAVIATPHVTIDARRAGHRACPWIGKLTHEGRRARAAGCCTVETCLSEIRVGHCAGVKQASVSIARLCGRVSFVVRAAEEAASVEAAAHEYQ